VRAGVSVEVSVEAKSFVPFHRLEVVMNGRVVASREDGAGAHEMTLRTKVQVAEPGWIAARCASRFGPLTSLWQLRICAHTSPVYLRTHGQDVFSAPGLSYMLTLIEGAETWVDELATRPDPERFEHVRKTFTDAREVLHAGCTNTGSNTEAYEMGNDMTDDLGIRQGGALDFLSLGALVHRLDPGIIPFAKPPSARSTSAAVNSMLLPIFRTASVSKQVW